jgi:hypothetical protein
MTISEANRNLFQDQLPAPKFETLNEYFTHLSDEHEYASNDFPCSQRLTVTSEAGKLPEALSMAMFSPETGELSFRRIATPPDHVLLNGKRNGISDLWFYLNWGTRFEAENVAYTVADASMDILFTTALLPADTWVKSLAARFPQLRFELTHAEPATGATGYLECNGGKVVTETTDDWIHPATWMAVGGDPESFFTTAIGCPFGMFEALEGDEKTPAEFLNALMEFDLDAFLYENGYDPDEDDEEESPERLEELITSHPNYAPVEGMETGWREPIEPIRY